MYYLSQPRDLHTLTLHRLDPATGEVTTVLSETGATRVEPNQWMYEPPIVRVLADEVLWYSQRDGWGHLYRYDLRTGALLGQVTSGQWAVRQILHVDEAERVVYFTASGLVEEDPYRRTVCRIGLDGSGFAKVTDDELDHIVTMPDNHGVLHRLRVHCRHPASDDAFATGPGGCWSSWSAPTSPSSPPPAGRRRNGSASRRPTG